MEEKLFDLVGLGVPFGLAAATYAVFAWLDNNASDEATKVISSWLRGRSHNKPDLGNLIINAFDSNLHVTTLQPQSVYPISRNFIFYLVVAFFDTFHTSGVSVAKRVSFFPARPIN
jgi:hypothetical protein